MPIGNVTSQIFANIYLNELDQFVKHKLRVKYYFRYADDFIIAHHDKNYLLDLIEPIQNFLRESLLLELHPKKVSIKKLRQGIDYLGYIVLPYHIILRKKTKKRMFKKLEDRQTAMYNDKLDEASYYQSKQSYLGMLKHCDGYQLSKVIQNNFGV